MKRATILIVGVALLYLLPSFALRAHYGPSYTFPPSEDYWAPDGDSGWIAHGSPSASRPSSPSVNVPLLLHYLPIFLPGILLMFFMFGPLSKKMHDPVPPDDESQNDHEATADIDPKDDR